MPTFPSTFGETLSEPGRCIDALKREGSLEERRGVSQEGRNRRWAASSERGGWLVENGGRVLKNPVEILKEFGPFPPTLSVSP